MMTLLIIVLFLLCIVLGIVIGYWIARKDCDSVRAKVAKMSDHELFMKRHGLKK